MWNKPEVMDVIILLSIAMVIPLRVKGGFTDFETTSKDWFNVLLRDDTDWNLHEGGLTDWQTGTNGDHTTGKGKFLYVDTSSESGASALLESRVLQTPTQGACVSFWYRVSGSDVGDVIVHKVEVIGGRTEETVWWTRKGHQGNKWNFGRVTIPASDTKYYQLVLEAKLGQGSGGVIALDDINLDVSQPCTNSLENGGFMIDFETETTAMRNKENVDHFDWIIQKGQTPSSGTGPFGDITSGNGHYLYLEASKKSSGQIAYYLSFPVPPSGNGACLSFYYHMNGDHVGTLTASVLGKPEWVSTARSVWTRSGGQGNKWHFAEVTLDKTTTAQKYEVMFTGMVGNGYQGDIAIDDIMLQNNGSC